MMRNKSVALIVVILLASLSFSQNKISLLNTENVKDYLELSQEQIKVIVPKIERIKAIIGKDKKIIEQIKERVKNDDERGFFEKIKVKRGHDKRASQIDDLIDGIEDQFNDEQKINLRILKNLK